MSIVARGAGFVVALALAASAAVGPVSAHGVLERSDPRAGARLRTPPAQVRLWFAGGLEPAYSRARVTDEGGRPVNAADSRVDAGNRALLVVPVPPLGPGRYRVEWRVLAVDGHVTEGSIRFEVAP